MLKLSQLLKLQLAYYVLGIGFNAVSLYCIHIGSQQLTPNEPIMASVFMTVYATLLIPGFLKKITLYRILMVVAVLLMGYGGVFKHINLIRATPELYASLWAGAIGISINVFGLILNLMGALGKFKM